MRRAVLFGAVDYYGDVTPMIQEEEEDTKAEGSTVYYEIGFKMKVQPLGDGIGKPLTHSQL